MALASILWSFAQIPWLATLDHFTSYRGFISTNSQYLPDVLATRSEPPTENRKSGVVLGVVVARQPLYALQRNLSTWTYNLAGVPFLKQWVSWFFYSSLFLLINMCICSIICNWDNIIAHNFVWVDEIDKTQNQIQI